MQNRSTLVLELTQELSRATSDEPFPLRLCRAFTTFANADGGAISIGFTTSERTLLCVTDDLVALFEDVQDTLREGPTLDAFQTARPVTCATWEEQVQRWPVPMETMPESVSSTMLYAFPMLPGRTLVGVVSLHVRPSRELARNSEDLDFLADVVGAAVIGGIPAEEDHHAVWSERDKVSQATGMIVAQLGVSAADALAVLRAHAFAHEASVAEISRAVLARELAFSDPEERDS